MSVLVVTHKMAERKLPKGYKYIQVGAYKGHFENSKYLYDDIGDNISEKNANFCELTAFYWAWKNQNDSIIGINHYRRFFSHNIKNNSFISEDEITRILDQYDIVLPFITKLSTTVEEHYKRCGYISDLYKVGKIIEDIAPEYSDVYYQTLKGDRLYLYNMMILKKEQFNKYCEWMFPILFELEKSVCLDDYDEYFKRIFGFIAERLVYVYVKKNRLNVFEMGVENTEDREHNLKNIMRRLKRCFFFKIR